MKTLCLFVFHEVNKRVLHFINYAIYYNPNIDFIIISNNKNNIFEYPNYCKVFFRDNIGLDFGGWSDALLTNDLYKKYDKFIFANSSIIGPFLPSSFQGRWTDIFLNGLKDNIKLFGITINSCADPINMSHVQSYVFSIEKETLEYLITCGIFNNITYAKNSGEAINLEIQMSRKIIEKGWNIGCLMNYYKNVDFRFINKSPNDYVDINFNVQDLMYDSEHNKTWNEYELVFIKGNRDIKNNINNGFITLLDNHTLQETNVTKIKNRRIHAHAQLDGEKNDNKIIHKQRIKKEIVINNRRLHNK